MKSMLLLTRRAFLKGSGAAAALVGASSFAPGIMKSALGSADKMTVWNIFPTLQNEYWQAWNAGASQAAAALGIDYKYEVYEDSVDKQLRLIETAGTSGVDGIFMFAQNAEASVGLISKAADLGVGVVNANSTAYWKTAVDPAYKGAYVKYIQADEVENMLKVSQAVFDAVGNEGEVIYISGLPGNWVVDEREEGFLRAVKANPGIKMVANENAGENRTAARAVIENLMIRYPNVKAFVVFNDDSAMAGLAALRERGMRDVKVGSIDCINDFLDAIIRGPNAIGSVSIFAPWVGAHAIVSLYDHLNGVELDPVERMIYNDSFFVDTPEAAAKYKELFNPTDPLPFDFKKMSRHLNPDDWNSQAGIKMIDPRNLWHKVARVSNDQPADFSIPEKLEASIEAGNLEKYNGLYKEHYTGGPIGEVLGLANSKETILGFS